MQITLNLYATFRLIAGLKTIPLQLPQGTTVRRAMLAAVLQVAALRSTWFDADGETLHAHVHALLRGEDVTGLPEGWETILSEGEALDIFPPVAGG